MTATASEASSDKQVSTATTAPVPKRITNAQTVCNEKNEKGKPCWGHLKQLKTAGEPAEVHLRGDDVLFKCQTCGTYYMGPPLGHVRDPEKQHRFVEAELSALLQAAGGTLPVIKKDSRGVFIMETTAAHALAAKPGTPAAAPTAAAPAAAKSATPTAPAAAKAAAPATAKPAAKAGAEPNRQLFHRTTYAGVVDTGPVAGETFEQKVARLKAVSEGAKRRAEEGGGPVAPAAAPVQAAPAEVAPADVSSVAAPEAVAPAPPVSATPATGEAHKPTGQADRTLMLRSTYCGVTDTGPVAGETFEQKVQRLAALAAAAKQRADGG
jgi:hypothetical protein